MVQAFFANLEDYIYDIFNLIENLKIGGIRWYDLLKSFSKVF